MAKINAGSPYFVVENQTNLTSAQIDIWIYSGAAATLPNAAAPTYTMSATAVNEEVVFEIGELVKDYIDIIYDGNPDTNGHAVYVDYAITPFISGAAATIDLTQLSPTGDVVRLNGFLGKGYFEEEENPQLDKIIMLDSTTFIVPEGETVKIPALNTSAITWTLRDASGNLVNSGSSSAQTNSNNFIEYISFTAPSQTEVTFVPNENLRLQYGDRTQTESLKAERTAPHYYTLNVDDSSTNENLIIKVVCEPKYTTHKVTFLNRYGAFQELWFFKRHDVSTKVDAGKPFKKAIQSSGAFNSYDRHYQRLLTNGKRSITMNTGFMSESDNEIIEDLLHSEHVWVLFNNKTLAVNPTTSDIKYKQSVNGELANHTIEFEFAFERFNNVK